DPAVVIATSEHTAAIAVCLGTFHLDVDELKRRGDLVVLDARDTLATFMADGAPDRNAFRRHVGGVFNEITRGRARCSVRAYGEMVDLLWKDGMTGAAIQVESLWN